MDRGGTHVGIDLAWGRTARTGLAAVDDTGALAATGVVRTDDELDAWLREHAPEPAVVGVDAPLVVPNATGQRAGEREIGRAYSRYGAAAYPANRANPLFDPPRASTLAARHGWQTDPDAPMGSAAACLEVYPHAALVGLFRLPQRVLYKKGRERRAGFLRLVELLEQVPELGLPDHPRWSALKALIDNPARGDLTRIEDEIDAIICAHIAWLWSHRRETLQVYGSFAEGYIVAPPPPTHAPQSFAARARRGMAPAVELPEPAIGGRTGSTRMT